MEPRKLCLYSVHNITALVLSKNSCTVRDTDW